MPSSTIIISLIKFAAEKNFMELQIGDKAPDFKLFNTEKKEIALHDFSGKTVVLLFFPFAFSSTCEKEMCEVRDDYSFYSELNAEVIGISCDSLFANKQFKKHYAIPFTFLSDYNKDVSALYDSLEETWGYNYKGVTKRSVFVIDKHGNIAHIEILAKAGDYPDMQTLKNTIEKIK
jgi:peroxiredoxin